jgi:hypothetical protein
MSICGLIINLESKRNEFFLSIIVFELKYPRLRSFHQIYFSIPFHTPKENPFIPWGSFFTTSTSRIIFYASLFACPFYVVFIRLISLWKKSSAEKMGRHGKELTTEQKEILDFPISTQHNFCLITKYYG